MVRNIFLAALAVSAVAGIGYANPSASNKVVIPFNRTTAANGKQMYVNYCAPCHGVDGRGQGPMAAALKKQPTDLALLSSRNGGKFPSNQISAMLKFGEPNPSHGTAQMPVWGPVFSHMDASNADPGLRDLRISNVSRYIQMLQVK